MIRLECDYACGMHPGILAALAATNDEQTPGYGLDPHCAEAARLIREACDAENADVHFLTGGTQTNMTVISTLLRPHQGVISAESGHINAHETGAVELTGHKVLTVPSADGKITARQLRQLHEEHWSDGSHEHIVQPGMVYISHPTEYGTIYSKSELEALNRVCREYRWPLYMDGARLGYALASPANDLSLADLVRLCDVFYIGGTKVGALFGEAVVIANLELKTDFRYHIKQKGGMLAKGRFLGLQFEILFRDGLYAEIGRHAVGLALELKKACEKMGIRFLYDSPTNQQFPILPDRLIKKLQETYSVLVLKSVDATHSAVRICTSWNTRKEDIAALIRDIERF